MHRRGRSSTCGGELATRLARLEANGPCEPKVASIGTKEFQLERPNWDAVQETLRSIELC